MESGRKKGKMSVSQSTQVLKYSYYKKKDKIAKKYQ